MLCEQISSCFTLWHVSVDLFFSLCFCVSALKLSPSLLMSFHHRADFGAMRTRLNCILIVERVENWELLNKQCVIWFNYRNLKPSEKLIAKSHHTLKQKQTRKYDGKDCIFLYIVEFCNISDNIATSDKLNFQTSNIINSVLIHHRKGWLYLRPQGRDAILHHLNVLWLML